jgi:ribonuclease VapC
MFVDACALVAILSGEPEAPAYAEALRQAEAPFTSPLAAFEAIVILARPQKFGTTLTRAQALVQDFLQERAITLRWPSAPEAELLAAALAVAQDKGLGKRHLSAFDCFHYAQARTEGAVLLTLDQILRSAGGPVAP